MALRPEQRNEDDDGRRQDVGREHRRQQFEAFERGQHRDRRRDHGVAGKQRGAGDAEKEHQRGALAERGLGQRHQRQDAALALVVRPHQEQDIFGGDGEKQRPEQQRYGADDAAVGDAAVLDVMQRLAQGVKRAGADVAEDDAKRSEGEGGDGAFAMPGRRVADDGVAGRRRTGFMRDLLRHSDVLRRPLASFQKNAAAKRRGLIR